MIDKIVKLLIVSALKVRWSWFHVSPRYIKFKMSEDSETYFQDMKTGDIVCDYRFAESESDNDKTN